MLSLVACAVMMQCFSKTQVDLLVGFKALDPESAKPLDAALYFEPVDPSKPTVLDPNKPTQLNGWPHLMSGIRQKGDKLVYNKRLTSMDGILVTKTWGMKYIVPGGTITSIQAISQKMAYQTGSVSIIEGGVGKKFVILHFLSQWGMNMDYVINIYVSQ